VKLIQKVQVKTCTKSTAKPGAESTCQAREVQNPCLCNHITSYQYLTIAKNDTKGIQRGAALQQLRASAIINDSIAVSPDRGSHHIESTKKLP
jgi:hypothetical protein